ncbi:MAG: ABC transporter ATP-binding protein [Rhodospirillales bacterium]|nr:ABC transporter ATP-binding protein [Rhodospirillales bacterium]
MTAIRIDDVARAYGPVVAVAGVSLDIVAGELFTLLGPSGCGKTTLLRMVAGFSKLDRGRILFGDRRIDTVPPHRRNAGMVFQNYAIFPNMTVGGNVAYGLKARHVPGAEMKARIARALELVRLGGFGERWPHQLSGGQLQRVALARCLVVEPDVLLLDEPLSNLDAQLRVEMRAEIRALQQKLRITTIYVTHDQEEALAISDRVAVMRGGRVQQLGTPANIYRRPASAFVAAFLGTTNLLSGPVVARTSAGAVVLADGQRFTVTADGIAEGARVSFSLRPEAIHLSASGEALPPGWAALEARVARIEFLGAITRIEFSYADGALLRVAVLGLPPGLAEGATARLVYDPAQTTVFPAP